MVKRIIQNKKYEKIGNVFIFLLGTEGSWKDKVTTFSLSQIIRVLRVRKGKSRSWENVCDSSTQS